MYHWAMPVVLTAISAEIAWYLLVQRRAYPWREMFASVVIRILQIPLRFVTPLVVGPVAYFVWRHRVATVPLDTAWGLALLFLGEEFVYYWAHRAGHEVRWVWASHVVHHTPEHIHLASAFRLGLTELLSGNWLFRMPLYLLGFNPVAVAAVMGINVSYQFFLHTDLIGRLGPLEYVLNTPAHHRVHHASNRQYLDRNYGGILIVFDRLFGTFAREEPGTRITYGLVHPIGSLNPIRIVFHEWVAIARDIWRARSWRERLRLAFGRPSGGFVPPAPALPKGNLSPL
jgi:sterol desaturase/sphingolipid hydroxylase (fatty acid hydroxylase superfamily)